MEGLLSAEFVKWLIAQGIGLTLAAMIFYFYRRDMQQYTEQWRDASAKLTDTVRENAAAHRENTASNVKLITLIEGIERNVMRKGDIEGLIDSRLRDRDR